MPAVTPTSRAGFIRTIQYRRTLQAPMDRHQRVSQQLTARASLYRAEKCRRDLAYFIRYFWPSISNETLSWNWHIDYIAIQLMEMARLVSKGIPRTHDLIINIPPGTTKSTIVSIMFPVWCWVNWPWMKFIAASYSGALALEHAEISRDLVRASAFKELFPDIAIKQDKDTKSNFRLVYTDTTGKTIIGGSRLSTSVGGTLTGFHGHILIVDDPLDPNRSVSTVELKATNNWIDQTLSTRKIDKSVTPTILIMQRLHQNDPTGHILKKGKDNVRLISLPGEIRDYRKYLNPPELAVNYIDDLLDAKRMPWTVMEDMKATLGQYGYAGQIGQNPVPPAGGMFKADMFMIIPPNQLMDMVFEKTIRYWDKAGTAGAGAFTAGVKMAKVKGVNKFVVLDVKKGQWSTDERERIIRATAEADGIGTLIYHEQEPGSGGKDSAHATTTNLTGFSVVSERATGDKVWRADPFSVQVNNGNVMVVQAEWNMAYIDEHRFFPFGTFKDQVDASSGAFTRLVGGRQGWML